MTRTRTNAPTSALQRVLATAALCASALAQQGPALGGARAGGAPPPERIVVGLLPFAAIDALAKLTGTLVSGAIPSTGIYRLELAPSGPGSDASAVLAQLALHPFTLFAERDPSVGPPESSGCGYAPPGSGAGAEQCTIAFVDGAPSPEKYTQQVWLEAIGAPAAQALSKGFPAVVAVIDTGIDPSHPLLAGRLAGDGFDFILGQSGGFDVANGIDDDGDGQVDEGYGHGTHVAGTVLLVDPDARILPYRVLDSDGRGFGFDVARAIFAAAKAGADVINLSLTMSAESFAVAAALEFATFVGGATVVAAAGNTAANDVRFPATYDPLLFESLLPASPPGLPSLARDVLAVTAVDPRGKKASFAGFGDAVDLCAPGLAVYSSIPGGGYAWWSGTSMATAVASGGAALVRSIKGGAPLADLPGLLTKTAQPLDAQNQNLVRGLGAGRIDLLAAGLAALAK